MVAGTTTIRPPHTKLQRKLAKEGVINFLSVFSKIWSTPFYLRIEMNLSKKNSITYEYCNN
jgi:hypothetical protein